MGFLLQIDNRALVRGTSFSYLSGNHYSGITSITPASVSPFAANGKLLLGEIGQESSEICSIATVSSTALALSAATTRAHADATRALAVPYDTVRFYWTATATFDTANPVGAGAVAVTPNQWFTSIWDSAHTTGYGWAKFENSYDSGQSGVSSPIPYGVYPRNTAKNALDSFFSLLNGNDRRLVTLEDAWEWLNEAYDEARAALDMATSEYGATDGADVFSVVSGTQEYALPSDFSYMVDSSVTIDGDVIYPIDVSAIDSYESDVGNTESVWYIRNGYFGISPEPTTTATVTYRYVTLPTRLNDYSDEIDLPKTGFNALKDFMLYRAKTKLKQFDEALKMLNIFEQRIARDTARAVNRDSSRDCIDVESVGVE